MAFSKIVKFEFQLKFSICRVALLKRKAANQSYFSPTKTH